MQNDLGTTIEEDYYQISLEILLSFSKIRPGIDLFLYDETIMQLYPFSKKGQRLSSSQTDKAVSFSQKGQLFVARSDHAIYVDHLAKQTDFVLLDANLKEEEKRLILLKAFDFRLKDLIDQPLVAVYEPLAADLLVFAEYILEDHSRMEQMLPYLHSGGFNLVKHSINSMILGAWIYLKNNTPKLRDFEALLGALLLHDIGLSKVPAFIVNKKTPLTREEQTKFDEHVKYSMQLVKKFGIATKGTQSIIYEHHEMLDGSGYPRGVNQGINEFGMLGAVADAFCVMLTDLTKQKNRNILLTVKDMLDSGKYARDYCQILLDGIKTGVLKEI